MLEVLNSVDVAKCSIDECAAIYSLANRLAKFQMSNLVDLLRPDDTRDYLRNAYMGCENEIFGVILLDNKNRIITCIELFYGTINGASVYPREIIKIALKHNAAGCIFFHNHPSGNPEPSIEDRNLTDKLKNLLLEIDIRVLDHFVIGKGGCESFAERGFL